MQVEVNTVEEFCAEVSEEAKLNRIFDKVVRLKVDRTPEQDEEVSFQLGLWATVWVKTDDSQWVIQFASVAGTDEPSVEITDGSRKVEHWIKMITEQCERLGLTIRDGKWEMW